VSSRNEYELPGAPAETSEDLDKLLAAVGQGEDAAFELVYEQLREPVYRHVLALLRNPAQSEEVTQEVLLELWCTAVRYDPGRSTAVAWATMIARRRAIDRVRSAAAATARDHQARAFAALWDPTQEAATDMFDYEQLTGCLDTLSGPQREAITLAFYEGHTYSQVAATLGVPLGTIKGRIREGLIKLRRGMLSDG
jgi:RNA polymerase sigma-70 factor, ECF subfamily